MAVLAVCSLLLALLPVWPARGVEAASGDPEDLEVMLGGGSHIGNLTYAAENAFINFTSNEPGFSYSKTGRTNIDPANGDIFVYNGDTSDFVIDVDSNPTLKAVAQSPGAEIALGWSYLDWFEERTSIFNKNYGGTEAWIYVNGVEILHDQAWDGGTPARSATVPLRPHTRIEIQVIGVRDTASAPAGARGLYVKFQDKTRPEFTDYTFTGNGQERDNNEINQRELYVKRNENVTMTYNFSEPVRPYAIVPGIMADAFLKHPLFTNEAGTGLPAAGQAQYLINKTYDATGSALTAKLKELHSSIVYQYTGVQYHSSGNPLEPKMLIDPADDTSGDPPMDQPLEEKLKTAVLADGAGNAVLYNTRPKPSASSNSYLKKANPVDPFDFKKGGYRVIVDAVPPKYSKVGNGIQPQILTGVNLNKKDQFDFTVQLSEPATIRKYPLNNTILLLNNGMRATYADGVNSDKWTFSLDIPDGKAVETSLLKVIALTNESAPVDPATNEPADRNVLEDYAGNLLSEPANFDGIWPDDENADDRANVNSKIDWAKLSIDNTPPVIGFRYESGGADNLTYRKNGKVTIDANDAPLVVPPLDPEFDPVHPGATRPSEGIYRPSNLSGAASPSVGLVYYAWTDSEADPFANVAGDHFAAVKRYAMSAKQPREDLYPGDADFAGLNLGVVNNKTNLIPLPAEALLPENSGEWYLHAWTADMTWDSARELMQDVKKDKYIKDHAGQYQDWLDEATGSEADKIFYANTQALNMVGDYGNLSVWPLDDYKHDDSNWTHNVTLVKVDNAAPEIEFGAPAGDDTASPQLDVHVADDLSGLASSQYQWVKDGATPSDVDWKELALTGGSATLSAMNDVFEDGSYRLVVKAADLAGNAQTMTSVLVTVNSANAITGSFQPVPDGEAYAQSHAVNFLLGGSLVSSIVEAPVLLADSVGDGASVTDATYSSDDGGPSMLTVTAATYHTDSIAVGYAFSPNPVHPEGDSSFAPLTAIDYGNGILTYTIPADASLNGKQYLFMMAKMNVAGLEKRYYFSRPYYFDNKPPEVTFSKTESAYPQKSQEVTVTVAEPNGSSGSVVSADYLIVRQGQPEPDELSSGWIELPGDGKAILTNDELQPGETQNYVLYVKAEDAAGNVGIAHTGSFNISKPAADVPPSSVSAGLLYVSGDSQDGYTAIVKLGLDAADKTGYDYSVSPDGGTSWVKWSPYTNFVALKVPTDNPADMRIQVKFRTPGGTIGQPVALDTSGVSSLEPVYALASLNKTKPVKPDEGVVITVAPPLGIKATPAAVNPSAPIRNGNTFAVHANGVYSFDLTDIADGSRTDTLYISVANIDGTKPTGEISYLTTRPTNGNVTVQLDMDKMSEPVKVINNNGSATYTFTDNGNFAFRIADEAGNENDVTAKVDYIDRRGAQVKVVRSYTYGENDSQSFGTIIDNNGDVRYASGVNLTVVNADGKAETEFTAPDDRYTITMQKNGMATFTIVDNYGTTSKVNEYVDNIIAPPDVDSVAYTFVDEEGKPLPADRIKVVDGQNYAKGFVRVTLTGKTVSPNKIFAGTAPAPDPDNGGYSNLVSAPNGAYSYSKTFSANGNTAIALSDLLGNVVRTPVEIAGLDNTPPSLELGSTAAAAVKSQLEKLGFKTADKSYVISNDTAKLLGLGGFTATDNVSAPEHIRVSIKGLDIGKAGGEPQLVTYTAVDEVGNSTVASQYVTIVSEEGMNIFANGQLISASSGLSAIFDTSTLVFDVSKFNVMTIDGKELVNEAGTYDLMYQPGLYREGQMKYIATDISYDELVKGGFKVTLPSAGWYTVIVRNQERDRVFASFFVSRTD